MAYVSESWNLFANGCFHCSTDYISCELNHLICFIDFTSALYFSLRAIPLVLLQSPIEQLGECNMSSNITGPGSVECCSAQYQNTSAVLEASFFKTPTRENIVMQIVQGTGIVEHTLAFYGVYSNVALILSSSAGLYYNMPLAYICITLVFMLVSYVALHYISSISSIYEDALYLAVRLRCIALCIF